MAPRNGHVADRRRLMLALPPALLGLSLRPAAALTVEVLRPIGGLPPHVVGLFEEPAAFQQVPGGPYYVFDRRAQTVYTVDAARESARKLVTIGQEQGRIIQPQGFDVAADGSFVVADAPRAQGRIQLFGPAGVLTSSFILPGRPTPSVTIDNFVLNVPYTYVYDAQGDKVRTIQFSAAGTLSPTSMSFTRGGRLLVTPGCFEFNPAAGQ